MALAFLLVSTMIVGCSGLFSSGSPTPTPTPSHLALNKLKWCGKPAMVFRDEGAPVTTTVTVSPTATASATATGSPTATGTTTTNVVTSNTTGTPATNAPQTITDWNTVKANLGFAVFLPPTLARSVCLVSAQATIHDPIFGGSFTIGYLLPDHSSLSLSEAPLTSQSPTFQRNATTSGSKAGTPTAVPSPGPTPAPKQLCSGARETTNIVLSARGTTDSLQQLFNSLQPDIDWVPAS